MRSAFRIGLSAVLLPGMLLMLTPVSVQGYYDEPPSYSYRRPTIVRPSSYRSSSYYYDDVRYRPPRVVAPIVETRAIGVSLHADRREANPGDEIAYWIRIRNLSGRDLPPWRIAFFLDPRMQVSSVGGGRLEGDHVTFAVPAMGGGGELTYGVRVLLHPDLAAGEVLRTYASMIWDGQLSPACAKHDLRIAGGQPITGAGEGANEVEDVRAFLTPVAAPMSGWMTFMKNMFSW